tara:strand:- start:6216 stop:7382 length:1167 start_codon:yes stop_codon:yes gene_type:complete
VKISKKISDSIELKFSKIARKMDKEKKIFYSLGLGEPDFNTPDFIVKSAFLAMKKGFTKYSNPAGIFDLRNEICKKLKKENKINSIPEEIIITPGSKMALSLALMSLLQPNDEIIYISPAYTSYLPQILLSENKVIIKKLNLDFKTYEINFNKLKKLISHRTKVILINFPHNPTGKILNINIAKKFEKILKKYKKCFLISDEIYEKLIFNKKKNISPASIKSISNRVLTINGFSKAYAMTGWRIGYCHAKKNLIEKMVKIQQHINTNVPVFTQIAALNAYRKKSNHIKKFNFKLKKNNNYLTKKISSNKKISFSESFGGLFVFLNIKKTNLSSDKFCSGLLKKYSVAVTPGHYFGEEWKNYIRISLAQDPLIFEKAINYLDKYLKEIK